jgi:hypothetical protein
MTYNKLTLAMLVVSAASLLGMLDSVSILELPASSYFVSSVAKMVFFHASINRYECSDKFQNGLPAKAVADPE